ncbi:MAG: sigma-70 family RNA polymerase sigma factor [Planctomycetota bacterium]
MAWQVPETRPSILLRVQDSNDHEAWTVFESIYRPAMVRAAKLRGLQPADAEDVAQTILARLSQHPPQFASEAGDAKFRTWLARVTENAVIDKFRKQQRDAALISRSLESPDESSFQTCLQLEYQREVFQWAARIIRGEFSEDAWNSFWRTTIERDSVEQVARELERTPGSIYSSRARIMRRLREQVQRFDDSIEAEL